MFRGILRRGPFGQHCALRRQLRQSPVLALEKGSPSLTSLPVVVRTFAGRTNVNVLLLVEGEVFPTEGPILALRLVDHRDMRRYLRLVDQPVEVGSDKNEASCDGRSGTPPFPIVRSLAIPHNQFAKPRIRPLSVRKDDGQRQQKSQSRPRSKKRGRREGQKHCG